MSNKNNTIVRVEHLPSLISALVAGGISLAVIYEFVFYLTLGLSFRNYLEIPDIIRTGLLIVPFYPIFISGSFLAGLLDAKINVSKSKIENSSIPNSSVSAMEKRNPYKQLVVTALIFIVISYLLIAGSFMLFFGSLIALLYIISAEKIRYYATFFNLPSTVMHIGIIISISVISTLFFSSGRRKLTKNRRERKFTNCRNIRRFSYHF